MTSIISYSKELKFVFGSELDIKIEVVYVIDYKRGRGLAHLYLI